MGSYFLHYRRKRTALLTVEYNIHPPLTLDSPNDAQEPCTLVTHRNNFDLSLRDLFQSLISQRSRRKTGADLPTWVKTLALPHPDIPDAFTPPEFFIRAPSDPLSGQNEKVAFIKLESGRKLSPCWRIRNSLNFPRLKFGKKAHSEECYSMGLAYSNRKADQQKDESLMSPKVVQPSLDFWESTGAKMTRRPIPH